MHRASTQRRRCWTGSRKCTKAEYRFLVMLVRSPSTMIVSRRDSSPQVYDRASYLVLQDLVTLAMRQRTSSAPKPGSTMSTRNSLENVIGWWVGGSWSGGL